MLVNTPFDNYLIPGILLFGINGLANLGAAWISWRRQPLATLGAILLGAFLIGWIGAQVYWFEGVHWLHILYSSLGIIEFSLGVWLWRARQPVEGVNS
jgi:hypothetical protein